MENALLLIEVFKFSTLVVLGFGSALWLKMFKEEV